MAKVINVKIRGNDEFLNKKISSPNNEPIVKKNIPDDIQEIQKPVTTHMLLTVMLNGWARIPEVGENVKCKKQFLCPMGYNAIGVSNSEGAVCGFIFPNDKDVLHGTIMDDDKFSVLPETFVGTVVEHGTALQHRGHLMMIAVECPAENIANTFTVVMPGQSLLAAYGSVFTAKKEPKLSGYASVFGVYDGCRRIGIIAPMHRIAIPGTGILTLQDANKYPDTFQVKVVGDGCYNGNDRAIRVKFLLNDTIKPASNEEIAAADKKILKKYLAYLLREGECSTRELMMLSEDGKKKKAMLDNKYKEIMQNSADKLNAYFNLL